MLLQKFFDLESPLGEQMQSEVLCAVNKKLAELLVAMKLKTKEMLDKKAADVQVCCVLSEYTSFMRVKYINIGKNGNPYKSVLYLLFVRINQYT